MSEKALYITVISIAAGVALILAVLWGIMVASFNKPLPAPRQPVVVQAPVQSSAQSDATGPDNDDTKLAVSIGQTAWLHNGSDSVDVATSQKSLMALVTAATNGDRHSYDSVFRKGQAFRVGDGAEVQLIGQGTESGHIKILTGASAGKTGYVPQEWITKT
jgi:hypothetical protein